MSANVLSRVAHSVVFRIGLFLSIGAASLTVAASGNSIADLSSTDYMEVFCGAPIYAARKPVVPPVKGPVIIDVSIFNFAFDPQDLMINVGDTVRWTNNDGFTHTATSSTAVWDSGFLANGESFSFKFTSPGEFPYFCDLHPSMTGNITVMEKSTPTDTPTNTPTDTPTNTATNTATATATATPCGPTVVTNLTESDPGSLRDIIANACDGATITFNLGPGPNTIGLGTSLSLVINKNLTISGPGADVLEVARLAGPGYSVFSIQSGNTVTIEGLKIRGGSNLSAFPSGGGGAISNQHSTLTVRRCAFVDNQASIGGAIVNNGGDGGPTATLDVIESTFSGDNTASLTGGAIYNRGVAGGNAIARITNSTFSGNSANGPTGAILYNDGDTGQANMTVTNSTLNDNNASATITNVGTNGGIANFTIGNTILNAEATNHISNGFGTVTSLGYNIANDNGGGFLTSTGDQINTDPLLGPLQNNGGTTMTHAPSSSSPALDRGKDLGPVSPFGPTGVDQRGNTRPVTYDVSITPPSGGDRSDIGAVELSATSPTATNTPTSAPTPSTITSFDSALIAKHVISSPPLTGNKLGAAEVSGDCSVSSLDAAQIASYVTNDGGPIGTTGTTIDPPGPCGALPVSTPVLMGDVSGTAPVTTAGSGTASVSMPNISATPKHFTDIPVIVSDLTGLGVLSYDIQITFDPSVVMPNFVTPVITSGTMSAAMTLTTNTSNPGHLIISAYGDTALTGSGVLLALQFGTSFSGQTALTFENYTDSSGAGSHFHRGFLFNEGTPTVTLTNGSITLLGGSTPTNTPTPSAGSISGTVTYVNASAPPKFISNVTITGAGSPTVSTMTALPGVGAGTYTLTGFGGGPYTVTPTKPTGGVNSISSFDAGRIAQHVAGIPPLLDATHLIAADASNNGTVSSFDAGQLARFVVSAPPFGITGQWRFITPGPTFPVGSSPTFRFYPSVTSTITGEDYVGILVGEVSGNWNPSAAPIRPSNGPERSTAVELPNLMTPVDKEILIPVSIQGAANKGIIAYEFDLRYDPSVIQPLSDPVDVVGTVSRGLSVVINADETGLLRVVMYGAMPIDDNGVLLNLRFTAVGTPGSVSPLTWERIMFNEGEPRVSVTDGRIELY